MCHVVRITTLHLTSFNYQVSSSTGQKILWENKYRSCPQKQVYVKRYEHVFNKSEIIVIQITFNRLYYQLWKINISKCNLRVRLLHTRVEEQFLWNVGLWYVMESMTFFFFEKKLSSNLLSLHSIQECLCRMCLLFYYRLLFTWFLFLLLLRTLSKCHYHIFIPIIHDLSQFFDLHCTTHLFWSIILDNIIQTTLWMEHCGAIEVVIVW
jgi:hypothetical protein